MPKSCPVRARDTQFALPSTLLSPPSRQRGAEKNLLGSPLERRPRTVRSAKPLTFVVYLPLRAVTLSSRRYGDGAPSYGGSYGRRREKQRDGGGGGQHRGRTGGGTGGAASVSAPAASQRPCAAPLCLLARGDGRGRSGAASWDFLIVGGFYSEVGAFDALWPGHRRFVCGGVSPVGHA